MNKKIEQIKIELENRKLTVFYLETTYNEYLRCADEENCEFETINENVYHYQFFNDDDKHKIMCSAAFYDSGKIELTACYTDGGEPCKNESDEYSISDYSIDEICNKIQNIAETDIED